MTDTDRDRVRAWEETTGGFLNIPGRDVGGGSTEGVPF